MYQRFISSSCACSIAAACDNICPSFTSAIALSIARVMSST